MGRRKKVNLFPQSACYECKLTDHCKEYKEVLKDKKTVIKAWCRTKERFA